MKKHLLFIVFASAGVCAFAQIPQQGLLAYFSFDDSSMESKNPVVRALPSGQQPATHLGRWATDHNGRSKSALYANNNSGLRLNYKDSFTGLRTDSAITIALWGFAEVTQDNSYPGVVTLNNGSNTKNAFTIGLGLSGGMTLNAGIGTKSFSSTKYTSTSVSSQFAGQWHHVVMTYDGTDLKLYLDSQLMNSSAVSGLIDYSGMNAEIHIGHHANGYGFKGFIDDVAIYRRALSIAEIKQLYVHKSNTASVGEISRSSVKLYPNPANAVCKVEADAEILSLTVRNSAGTVVHQLNHLSGSQYIMDVQGWAAGLYMVEVQTVKGIAAGKILKD
ncbi:MAG: T9SS type A sorting domain-containing protein [Bacteroidetes bacterium]|nr:T9SS type A sorting domain-containing protein [Bacteroidota bacterium]